MPTFAKRLNLAYLRWYNFFFHYLISRDFGSIAPTCLFLFRFNVNKYSTERTWREKRERENRNDHVTLAKKKYPRIIFLVMVNLNHLNISLEVIERIIDIVAEHENDLSSIKACSLVSHPILPRCRYHIFGSVTLNARAPSLPPQMILTNFSQIHLI